MNELEFFKMILNQLVAEELLTIAESSEIMKHLVTKEEKS